MKQKLRSITITGLQGSGKDTLAKAIAKHRGHDIKDVKISNAYGVKLLASLITGDDIESYEDLNFKNSKNPIEEIGVESRRELLIKIGDGLREKVHPNVWNYFVETQIAKGNEVGYFIKTDDRYPEEIRTSYHYGFCHIHIINRNKSHEEIEKLKEVPSERMNLFLNKYIAPIVLEVPGNDPSEVEDVIPYLEKNLKHIMCYMESYIGGKPVLDYTYYDIDKYEEEGSREKILHFVDKIGRVSVYTSSTHIRRNLIYLND